MLGRRICYLTALLGCGAFYIAYGEWLSWLALLAVALLPLMSLVLSLPAMLGFSLEVDGADRLTRGQEGEVWLVGCGDLPLPPFRGKMRLHRCLDGTGTLWKAHYLLPTEHCGGLILSVDKARVYDYLGLISLPLRRPEPRTIRIRPTPVPVPEPPDLKRYIARAWRPKPGGGFAENHELRLYRPGDSLNQIHWKLTAKTRKLTIREPMLPLRGLVLLTMTLRCTPEEIDRKFGRLLWLGNYLLERQIPFQLRCMTGSGVPSFSIADTNSLIHAIDSLLIEPAAHGSIRDQAYAASWQYHIGGAP